ncbi:MAG: SH3 domain-containing protein [Clostridia bacterium]|nr:SH3 domain-containing protein [Clostridia bacterium]
MKNSLQRLCKKGVSFILAAIMLVGMVALVPVVGSATASAVVADEVMAQASTGTYRVTTEGGNLTLRESASSSSNKLDYVPNGTLVVITEISNGFGKTTYGGKTGWLSMSYLTFVSSNADPVPPSTSNKTGTYRVTTEGGNLTLRSSASSSGGQLALVPNGALVVVTEFSNGFGKTTYGGKTGWLSMSYLTFVSSSTTISTDTSTPVTPTSKTGTYKVTLTSGNLTLRSSASSSGGQVALVPNGTLVVITEISNGYGKTTYGGQTGWLSMSYLTYVSSSMTITTDTSNSGTTSSKTGTYRVTTQGGNLNMRPTASSSQSAIGSVPNGTLVVITEISNGYGKTTYGGMTGWLSMSYLTFVSSSTTISTDTSTPVTPTSKTGTYKVTLTNGNLILRSSASSSGSQVELVPNGTLVVITEISNGFGKTTYNGKTGWLSMSYLTFVSSSTNVSTDTSTPVTPTGKTGTYKVTLTNGNLVLRSSASSSGGQVALVPNGTLVVITEISNGFGKTTYNGKTGWLSMSYLTFVSSDTNVSTDTSTPVIPTSKTGTYKVTLTSGNLVLRQNAVAGSTQLELVPNGTLVVITEISNGFGKTTYNGKTGWLAMSYLTFVSSNMEETSDNNTPAKYTTGRYKITLTDGNLKLRATPISGEQLALIPNGTELNITEVSGEWGKTTYNGLTGWISLALATYIGGSTNDAPGSETGYALGIYTVTLSSGNLRLRSTPSASGDTLASIPNGTQITITEVMNDFGKTTYDGKTGWVSMAYLSYKQSSDSSEIASDGEVSGEVSGDVAEVAMSYKVNTEDNSAVKVHVNPDASSAVVFTIPNGTQIFVTKSQDDWGYVSHEGKTGWVQMMYLASDASDEVAEGTAYVVKTLDIFGSVKMHEEAGSSSKVLCKIPNGTTVIVQEQTTLWAKVTYNNMTGWVFKVYLAKGDNSVMDKVNDKLNEIIDDIKDTDYGELIDEVIDLIKGEDEDTEGNSEVVDGEVVPGDGEVVGGDEVVIIPGDGEVVDQPVNPSNVKYGDVNCDGSVNMVDVTDLQKIIASLTTHAKFGSMSKPNSDVDHDGDIKMTDVTKIQKFLANLVTTLDY